MEHGLVRIYYGEGRGKSSAALGDGMRVAGDGRDVILIQFLKGQSEEREKAILDRLEPEIKRFRFAKSDLCFDDLTEELRAEESVNLLNGFHYGQKVVASGVSDFVIFDEILGVADRGLISMDEIKSLVRAIPPETTVVFTGRTLCDEIRELADEIYHIVAEKV